MHTANSDVDVKAEEVVQKFVDENFFEMVHSTEIDFERKDALKILNSLKSAKIMLVWNDQA